MDILGPLLVLGLFVFLPLWLILKIGDFIERHFPSLWARMGESDDDQARLMRTRRGGWGDGGFGGDGGGA